MAHRTAPRPRKAARRHYEHAHDFLVTVRPLDSRTRQQRLALYEERAHQWLPLFGK
jgi:hypothetical protein